MKKENHTKIEKALQNYKNLISNSTNKNILVILFLIKNSDKSR